MKTCHCSSILVAGHLRLIGQRKREGRVDALQGLVQPFHVLDAIVILAQDDIDTAAEPIEQHDPGAAQHAEQDDQGQQRQEDALTQRERHGERLR